MEQIEKILLTPIKVVSSRQGKKKIFLKDGCIYTTCSLSKRKDCDVSDAAIYFYRFLYDFDKDWLPSEMFDGDTINSYNTVGRFASEGKKNFWANRYHCLANFWVLPVEIGRKTNELSKSSGGKQVATIESFNKGKRDYIDRFLHKYIESNKTYIAKYKEYSDRFPIKDFASKHFFQNIYLTEKNEVIDFSIIEKNKLSDSVDNVISIMWEKTEQRAKDISNSGKCDRLLGCLQNLEE